MQCCRWIFEGSRTSSAFACSRANSMRRRKMKTNLAMALAVLAAAMCPLTAHAQGAFEGTVNGTMTADGKAIPFRYSQLGSRIRTEYTMEGHNVASIYDADDGRHDVHHARAKEIRDLEH